MPWRIPDLGLADCSGVMILARMLAEDQRKAGMLSEAEATCRTLISTLRDNLGRVDAVVAEGKLLVGDIYVELASIVRAQGRLDEARQLCEEAISQHVVGADIFATGPRVLPYVLQVCASVGKTTESSMNLCTAGKPHCAICGSTLQHAATSSLHWTGHLLTLP